MTNQHPISPPPELVQRVSLQALESFPDDESGAVEIDEARDEYIATFFAQWGADQELEACCEWLKGDGDDARNIDQLRAARRPKPPSLKLEAMEALERQEAGRDRGSLTDAAMADADKIRRALEALPDD